MISCYAFLLISLLAASSLKAADASAVTLPKSSEESKSLKAQIRACQLPNIEPLPQEIQARRDNAVGQRLLLPLRIWLGNNKDIAHIVAEYANERLPDENEKNAFFVEHIHCFSWSKLARILKNKAPDPKQVSLKRVSLKQVSDDGVVTFKNHTDTQELSVAVSPLSHTSRQSKTVKNSNQQAQDNPLHSYNIPSVLCSSGHSLTQLCVQQQYKKAKPALRPTIDIIEEMSMQSISSPNGRILAMKLLESDRLALVTLNNSCASSATLNDSVEE